MAEIKKKVNGNRKGKSGELELSKKLREHGFDCRRGQQYCGAEGDADVLGLPQIHIECKRVEKMNVSVAMSQAIGDAKEGNMPTVFHRKSREPWLVTMRLDDWIELYKEFAQVEFLTCKHCGEKILGEVVSDIAGNDVHPCCGYCASEITSLMRETRIVSTKG